MRPNNDDSRDQTRPPRWSAADSFSFWCSIMSQQLDERIMGGFNRDSAKNELAFMIYEVEHGRSE